MTIRKLPTLAILTCDVGRVSLLPDDKSPSTLSDLENKFGIVVETEDRGGLTAKA